MSTSFSTNSDGVPLFACTKCNSRHPFEELSQGSQLCKNCRKNSQVLKCGYCRSEFQLESGVKSKNICTKCDLLQEQHGKPGPCAYCNIIAAFIGTKCQRCTNSEKKYGPPMSCEHCRQKCAFDRKDPEGRKKVDGKLLCWLCTMAFKRTLAKARRKDAIMNSVMGKSHHRSSGGESNSYSSTIRHHSRSSNSNGHSLSRSLSHNQSRTSGSHSSTATNIHQNSKKQRMDLPPSSSNGNLSTSLNDTRFVDPNLSDQTSIVAQLKDQVAALNKRLQIKEKDLMSKDKQIADLKSQYTREHKDLREKISTLQKQHNDRVNEMQSRLVTLQRQLASQTKAAKNANSTPAQIEQPLVM